ncbi:MAG: tRNA preQ1(34) S-adenosylmethionine ribosyltransferase-isomerase QueA [Verrucomicrobiaceae bacterium]|nr:tRNA preQ1(34) S-adenosylmethionine ribosyltransferase-isomerase QueA [Verrucomicrobiaceae bacterium]
MLTSDFDYHLPPELIASEPLADRSASRMMVVHRATGQIEHRQFPEMARFLAAGDLLVLNDTRVVPARFFTDKGHEILRLKAHSPTRWQCMVKPGKKFRIGHEHHIGAATGRVVEILSENGDRIIEWDQIVDESTHGHLALPHYMGRDDRPSDRERYQTVYSAREKEGSIAAPTAGLHFTPEILASLPHAFVTLHVGVGTFQPVKAEKITDHVMHQEEYEVSAETATRVQAAKRVICVGTTSLRTLESVAAAHDGKIVASRGSTGIFIYPGFQFRVAGALLTNFHLPKSTLMMLVSAFAGRELIFKAYAEAIREKYRFYSYGDCMLIL